MTHVRTKKPNAQRTYGVLVGQAAAGEMSLKGHSAHYEIWIKAGGADYRIAVNVRSVDGSEVMAHYDPAFANPTKLDLPKLAGEVVGFKALATGPQGEGLDYLRDGLFAIDGMRPVPADGNGDALNLHHLLDGEIQRAQADSNAVVIAFGEYFRDGGEDDYFHFSPEQGVHDIHMMQGNGGTFADDNRINGDGALFIRHGDGKTTALFIRFASQATATDETGAAV